MILSFKHNFLFIKTRKTAGTSIEVDLARVLETEAVVTPILPEVPGHVARNFMKDGRRAFYNHMRAAEVREEIGAAAFDRLFKFCIEREPVGKCLSYFHMRRNGSVTKPDDDFALDWPRYCEEGPFPVDTDKYAEKTEGGWRLLVDRVLPYETLGTELPALMAELGVEGFSLTTRAKSEYSAQTIVRPEEVTARERALIRKRFRSTIAVTGLYA